MQNLDPLEAFSTTEIAAALGVSRISIFRYIKDGKLKAVKNGRNYSVLRKDYDRFRFDQALTQETREELQAAVREMMDRFYEEELEQLIR